MGQLKVIIPDKIEQAFRRAAMRRFGYQRGSMSEAATEAMHQWASSGEKDSKEEGSWDALEGIMKDVKKTSVQLQHEAWNSIILKSKKVKRNAHRR